MSQNQFWTLLSKKLSGEITLDETKELEQLIKAYPDLIYAAQHLEDIWKLNTHEDPHDAELAFRQHLIKMKKKGIDPFSSEKTEGKNPSQRRLTKRRNYWVFATAIILLSVFSFVLFQTNKNNKTLVLAKRTNEIYSRPGTKTKLILPDSSLVWLNAGSKLTYAESFGISDRNVSLNGEAFFDVKKSPTPFIIQTTTLRIKVLGTAFNVRSYPNERKTETSLIRGRVEITLNSMPEKIFVLRPNEKLIVDNEKEKDPIAKTKKQTLAVLSTLKPMEDKTIPETSWVDNKLVFQDETFEEVARKLERWYNVKITIKSEILSQMLVGGGPFENETIQQALEALKIAFNFNFTIQGNDITITR